MESVKGFNTQHGFRKYDYNSLDNAPYVTPQAYGAIGDGSTDDTVAIQTAVNNHTNIWIPSGTYKVSFRTDTGDNMNPAVNVPSNRTIKIDPDVTFICDGVNLERYSFFRLNDVENVTIEGGKIIGDRESHTGDSGEWGMGISMSYARNVLVRNMTICDCWGDGICIGTIDNSPEKVCQNITIENVICDNNRRQGISVCGVDGFYLNNCKLINTNGTNPQAGIDFETNVDDIPQKRMFVTNLYTENNNNYGTLICTRQEMELTITNWTDVGSGTDGNPLHFSTQAERENGYILLKNVLLKDTPSTAISYSQSSGSFPITIKNIRLENIGINRSDYIGGTFLLFAGNNAFSNGSVGNLTMTGVEFNNPSIVSRDNLLFMNTYLDSTTNINNVNIEIDTINGECSPWFKDLSLVTNFRVNDKTEKIGYIYTPYDWTTLSNPSFRYGIPSSLARDAKFTIGSNMPIGLPFEIINNNPSGYGILLDCALPVLSYLTDNSTQYLKVAAKCGAKVVMCRYDENNFYIISGHEFLTTVNK